MMVPQLPAAQIRAAIQAEDWPMATELLAGHQRALATALAVMDRSTMLREPWLDLLLAQRALLDELHDSRNTAAKELARLGEGHRSARVWLRELA